MRIYETTYAAPASDTVIFFGRVDRAPAEGKLVTAKCSGFVESLRQKFPRFLIQPRCNYHLFDENCTLDKTKFAVMVLLHNSDDSPGQILGRPVKVTRNTAQFPDRFTGAPFGYFAGGFLVTGTGQQRELRSIKQSSTDTPTGDMILRLNAPLNYATDGDEAIAYPGCDGLSNTCKQKFKNFRRWGGHVVPQHNPTVSAVPAQSAHGNKK